MPRLTDPEKQDIIRYLEADRPLPDKYRFLLFEDKREVELVWNGKTNEVTNVVLPFQVIEQVDEPRAEGDTPPATDPLRPRRPRPPAQGLDQQAHLGRQQAHPVVAEKRPAARGDRAAGRPQADLHRPALRRRGRLQHGHRHRRRYLHQAAQHPGGDRLSGYVGQGADSFLAMIYERLILIKGLLSQNGSIYVHCDWRVNSTLRLVMDEIFGSDRFLNEIIWKRTSARSDSHTFNHIHDSILFYSKTATFQFNEQFVPHDKGYLDRYYTYTEPDGRRFATIDATQSGCTKWSIWC